MFATFFLERDPLTWSGLPAALVSWTQCAGAVACIGLVIWCIAWVAQNRTQKVVDSRYALLVIPLLISLGIYIVLGLAFVGGVQRLLPASDKRYGISLGDWLFAAAGAASLFAVLVPFVSTLFSGIRWQRIRALAGLAFKEATRSRRVVLVFSAMALVFLFAGWFVPYKAEDQVRNYVRVVYWSMLPLFLVASSLLGAFGIPADVKSQSIHTIVTKPVDKFEIVLGRFFGYAALITISMFVVGALSLLYVLRGIHPEAEKESKTARVPIYGMLGYHGTKGDSVGREWDYRRYIAGPHPRNPNAAKQYAIWSFQHVPSSLRNREEGIPFEFTFDIFRLTKGEESKGIHCTFTFMDGRLSIPEMEQRVEQANRERIEQRAEVAGKVADPQKRLEAFEKIDADLSRKHAIYSVPSFEVTDYHTQKIVVPPVLFERLVELESEKPRESESEDELPPPMLKAVINVDRTPASMSQLLGVARADFYLLDTERAFWINFLKGVMGMWCTCMLVLGVSICLSTYLSGVISWLCTLFLFIAGANTEFIQKLATNQVDGGGPFEAAYRILTKQPLAAQLESSPTSSLLKGGDEVYRWLMGLFVNLVPDVNRHDLHQYVANGFDIRWGEILFLDNLLPLLGYLLPWAVLAFYLMKFREIANPM